MLPASIPGDLFDTLSWQLCTQPGRVPGPPPPFTRAGLNLSLNLPVRALKPAPPGLQGGVACRLGSFIIKTASSKNQQRGRSASSNPNSASGPQPPVAFVRVAATAPVVAALRFKALTSTELARVRSLRPTRPEGPWTQAAGSRNLASGQAEPMIESPCCDWDSESYSYRDG